MAARTRMLRHSASRRVFAGWLAALGCAASLPDDGAAAKCRKPCGPCKRCKRGRCRPKPNDTPCSGGFCQRGRCVRPSPGLCAGLDFCVEFDGALCDDGSLDATCVCLLNNDNGQPFCARSDFTNTDDCATCGDREICVDVEGEVCDGTRGCARPCPNPA